MELPDINQLLDENESDDEASEERGLVPFENETSEAVYSQTETSEAVEGPDPIETETSKSVVDPDPIETVAVDSQTETSVETDPATSSGKRGEKRPWTKSAEEFLRRAFKSYLTRKAASVHNTDIIMAQNTCAELSERSKAQIRSKLNNMKLGKSK
ncbi:uncharacterized protein LOC128208579 [Mya arenaria]|uniref:uncharacterized protein LOC128208579 n=1 Tax=Mya arenaria TaxID=6604 RepID=UPI0022E46856|nr:uncharacterized protein LOC128208579 [Mya arenaria]